MKKLVLIVLALSLIIPAYAFIRSLNVKTKTTPKVTRHLKIKGTKPTTFDLGYFDANGVTYHMIGDNYGGGSGNIVSMDIGGAPVDQTTWTGTWSSTGLLHVSVTFGGDFSGNVYY